MSLLGIFLLIGVANWAQHIMLCPTCRGLVFSISKGITGLFLDGAVHCLGWPFDAIRLFKPSSNVQIEEIAFIDLTRTENESEEDYKKRIAEKIREEMGKHE
jgi:hypothetical protein